MNSLTLQAIALMALCYGIGALAAWLLAVALYPHLREVSPSARHSARKSRHGRQRSGRRSILTRDSRDRQRPVRVEPQIPVSRLDDDHPDDAPATRVRPRDILSDEQVESRVRPRNILDVDDADGPARGRFDNRFDDDFDDERHPHGHDDDWEPRR